MRWRGLPEIRIALSDPMGSALFNWFAKGELKAEGNSVTEGIGQGRITANLEGFTPDFAYRISDAEALPLFRSLLDDPEFRSEVIPLLARSPQDPR